MPLELRQHHVGVACKDLGKALASLERTFGVRERSEFVYDEAQDAELCMVVLQDGSRIELIAGKTVEGLIGRGVNYYHVAYEVDDIDSATREMRDRGCLLVSGPTPAPLFDDRPVAFLYAPTGLIELVAAP